MIKDGCQCFTCRHADEPRVVAGYLQGYIDACDWFLNWAKKNNIKQGSIADDDLGGIVAQMDCNRVESSCLLTCLPDLEIEEVKSQDECKREIKSKSGRDSEVLISTIEELERVKKQLEIAVDAMRQIIREYFSCYLIKNTRINGYEIFKLCDNACKKIEELER